MGCVISALGFSASREKTLQGGSAKVIDLSWAMLSQFEVVLTCRTVQLFWQSLGVGLDWGAVTPTL